MKPRVLFVDEDQERNGSTVSLEYLVRGFASAGYEVFVLTWKVQPESKALLSPPAIVIDGRSRLIRTITLRVHFAYTFPAWSWRGIRTIAKDGIKFVAGILIVSRAIRRLRPALVYANEYSVVQASVAAALSGVRSAVHVRSPIIRGSFGVRRWLVSRLLLLTNDVIIAITRREAEQLHARGKVAANVRVVGEFVPCIPAHGEKSAPEGATFGFLPGKKVVTTLGGIRDIKGTLDFLRAAEIISQARSDVLFVIAGNAHLDGSRERRKYYDRCREVIARLEARGTTRVLGGITNPLDLVLASDVIVSASTESHFSRPVVEAWKCGKPVVAAKTPHMEDLIREGVDGLLVPPGDERGIARAVTRLLDDENLSAAMGLEGRRKADAEYDADSNLRRIIRLCASESTPVPQSA